MGRDGPLVDTMQPFILYNIPSVDATTERWSSPEYMEKIFGKNTRYATEHSTDNHFMYFNHKLVSFFPCLFLPRLVVIFLFDVFFCLSTQVAG